MQRVCGIFDQSPQRCVFALRLAVRSPCAAQAGSINLTDGLLRSAVRRLAMPLVTDPTGEGAMGCRRTRLKRISRAFLSTVPV